MTKYIFFDNNLEHRTLAEDIHNSIRGDFKITFVGAKGAFDSPEWDAFAKKVNPEIIVSSDDLLNLSDKELKNFFNADKSNFFFISRNADRNVSLAFMVMSGAKKFEIGFDKFSMFIAPNWEDVEAFLHQHQKDIARNFDIKLVNPSRLAAYTLSKMFHPVDHINFDQDTFIAKNDFKVALLGFSVYSRDTMFVAYQQGRFEGSKFIIDLYDTSAKLKFNSFKEKFAGFIRDVEFNAIDVESYKNLNNIDFSSYDIVIVDFGTPKDRIEFSQDLQEKFINSMNEKTTIAPFVDDLVYDYSTDNPNILPFGAIKSIYCVDSIIADSFTRGGRFVNDYYNSTKQDSHKVKSWIGLTDFERGSNVSVADFNYSFIRIIGRDLFASFKTSADYKKWLRDNPKKFDTLARIEHLRWCAYLYSNGWDKLPLSDELMVENKDMQKKLHTCLVTFDELKEVSEMFKEDYEKYDCDNVDIVFDIFNTLNKS